jgi:signal transduction histidine kinase
LLDVNKLESGRIVSTLGAVSLTVLEKVIQANQHYADTKGIRIELIQSEEGMMNSCVRADELALMQVFDNVLSNAIKYSPLNKGVKIQVNKELQPNISTSGENVPWVCIAIQDEGPGLTDDDKAKIFEKFARLSAKPTAGESSTGLGLAISKELMQQMNGEIGCESEKGEGATFFLRLPSMPQMEKGVAI